MVEVQVVSLDSLFNDRTKFSDVGLIWIDTEGYEEEIFKGASQLLSQKIPMVFEYSPGFYDDRRSERIIDLIFSAYAEISMVDATGFTPITREEMSALRRQMDIFCCG